MELGPAPYPRRGGLTVAAITRVTTIERVAEIRGEDVDWLWDVCAEMEPEDGSLWVIGAGDTQTIAFSPAGLEYLDDLIAHYKANPKYLIRSTET